VRATTPAKTAAEPARPKRPAGAAEERVRATRPAKPVVPPQSEAPGAGREPPGKKKRKREPQPERANPAWIWWLAGGGAGLFLLLVGMVVIVAVVSIKPEIPGSRKAQPAAAEPEGEWVDARTAAQLVARNPEAVANVLEIYAMGGECKFSKVADHPMVAIRLNSPHATDGLMSVLRAFPKLKSIDVSYSRVTDIGLQQFVGMKQLEELNIKNTNVTDQGRLMLRQALPDCNIIW
jgi:hypothetical protein